MDLVERLRLSGTNSHKPRDEDVIAAADEIERLRSALWEYGDHNYACELKNRWGHCTCGYEKALGGRA